MKRVPEFLQPYLWSYNLNNLKFEDSGVAKTVITQILNLGDEKAVRWLFSIYPIETIKNAVEKPLRGMWEKRALNYWSCYFNVGADSVTVKKAVALY